MSVTPRTPHNTTDLDMMSHPEWWPLSILPVKRVDPRRERRDRRRRRQRGAYDQHGFLIAQNGITVPTVNPMPPSTDLATKHEYTTLEQLADDGWIVD